MSVHPDLVAWQDEGLMRAFKMLVSTCDDVDKRPVAPHDLLDIGDESSAEEVIDELLKSTYGMMNAAKILVTMVALAKGWSEFQVLAKLGDLIELEEPEVSHGEEAG